MFDVVLNCLHYNDGIVHNQADSKHQAKQGKCVNGKTEYREYGKSADQRHWHSQQRNQSSPPSLKKDKHHENDENDGFNEGVINLDNAFSHRKSRIESHSIVKSRWKALFRLSH